MSERFDEKFAASMNRITEVVADPCGGADANGSGCTCDPPWMPPDLDKIADWIDEFATDRCSGECVDDSCSLLTNAADRIRELRVARHQLDAVRALHVPGRMLDHYEYGCTCGFRDHRWQECTGCGYRLNDEGEFDREIHNRTCPTLAALSSVPDPQEQP